MEGVVGGGGMEGQTEKGGGCPMRAVLEGKGVDGVKIEPNDA